MLSGCNKESARKDGHPLHEDGAVVGNGVEDTHHHDDQADEIVHAEVGAYGEGGRGGVIQQGDGKGDGQMQGAIRLAVRRLESEHFAKAELGLKIYLYHGRILLLD